MSLLGAWHHYLENRGAVSALVGSRIYRAQAWGAPSATVGVPVPQLPYLVLKHFSTEPVHDQSGGSGAALTRLQIDSVGQSEAQVAGLAAAVREAVDGLHATTLASGEVDETYVLAAHVEDEGPDIVESPDDGSQVGRVTRPLTMDVWHAQSVPTPG